MASIKEEFSMTENLTGKPLAEDETAVAPIVVKDPATSRDNEVRPFQIGENPDESGVRGRAVRLGTVAEQILAAHNYPEPVGKILGEALALVAMLGSILKREGMITLQMKSGGPIPMLVADYDFDGSVSSLRGYADVDQEKYQQYGKSPSFNGLIGSKNGYLAITIDPKDSERYQGIVDLKGDSLASVAEAYFKQSEQLPTAVQLAADRDPVTHHWRVGGAMIQHLARGEEGRARIMSPAGEEEWNRAKILLSTVKDTELLDPALTLDDVLFRLFHEDGVRVFDALRLAKGCRCERDRLLRILSTFSAEDREEMTVDGQISMLCQFCNHSFDFDPKVVEEAIAAKATAAS